ncbi:MAG: DUF4129 domain-containing protein [Pirellula sp.]
MPARHRICLGCLVLRDTGFEAFITLLAFVACALGILTPIRSTGAQSSSSKPSNEVPEYRHQRWLPLPPGRLDSVAELEKQLKLLPGSQSKPSTAKGDRPAINDKQVKQLQEIIKEFSNQLPRDFAPPNMDGLSNEAIARALEDPEVREKAQKLMEKFARSGGEIPQQLQQRREMIQKMEEFLKQIDESEAKRAARNQAESSKNNQTNRPDSGTRPSEDPAQPSTNEIRKQLDEKGFNETLRNIVEQARQSAEQQSAASSPSDKPSTKPTSPTSQNPNRQNPKGATNSSDNTKSPSFPSPNPNSTGPKSTNPSPTPNSTRTDNNGGWNKWFSTVLNDLNESVTKQSTQPAEPTNASPTETASNPSSPIELAWPNLWVWGALLAIIGCITVLLMSKAVRQQVSTLREARKSQTDLLRSPNKIQNRNDVIRAFHQLAYRIAAPVEEWWTHRIIARQACRNLPSVRSSMDIATEIYEQARYLPANVELTSDQLDSVRRALKDCEAERN